MSHWGWQQEPKSGLPSVHCWWRNWIRPTSRKNKWQQRGRKKEEMTLKWDPSIIHSGESHSKNNGLWTFWSGTENDFCLKRLWYFQFRDTADTTLTLSTENYDFEFKSESSWVISFFSKFCIRLNFSCIQYIYVGKVFSKKLTNIYH